MKKNAIITLATAAVLALACFGCASATTQDSAVSDETATTEAADDAQAGSVLAVHAALGQDLSGVTEASYEACTTCHEWETVVSSTDAYWEGLGQITDANPHDSHATNAFACSDCHTMAEPQVNICNQCHIFETPEGWVEKDKTTTNYGITATEPTI